MIDIKYIKQRILTLTDEELDEVMDYLIAVKEDRDIQAEIKRRLFELLS